MRALLLPALLALAVTPAAAQRTSPRKADRTADRYVAPTNESVTTRRTELPGSTPGHNIWIDNQSTVPITVFSATLRECENVRQMCGTTRLDIRIRPGRSAVILRVQAKVPNERFSYRSSYSWRADSTSAEALRVIAGAGSAADERLRRSDEAAAAERERVEVGDVDIDSIMLVSLADLVAALRTEPDSFTIMEGRAFLMRDVRVIALDSTGAPLGRVLHVNFRMPGNLILMNRADTLYGAQPGRTEIELSLRPPGKPLSVRFPVIVKPDTTGN